jgi:hypothetical protein
VDSHITAPSAPRDEKTREAAGTTAGTAAAGTATQAALDHAHYVDIANSQAEGSRRVNASAAAMVASAAGAMVPSEDHVSDRSNYVMPAGMSANDWLEECRSLNQYLEEVRRQRDLLKFTSPKMEQHAKECEAKIEACRTYIEDKFFDRPDQGSMLILYACQGMAKINIARSMSISRTKAWDLMNEAVAHLDTCLYQDVALNQEALAQVQAVPQGMSIATAAVAVGAVSGSFVHNGHDMSCMI